MDFERVCKIVRYAVALAGQKDEWTERQLVPIHLIKYVYLADLAYARKHDGQTYSGIDWTFHHFGPWATELYQSLDPALTPPFEKMTFVSKFDDKDSARWHIKDVSEDYLKSLASELPLECDLAVAGAVRRFGSDTYPLLQEVYRSGPMLRAKPGESLAFRGEPKMEQDIEEPKVNNPKLRRKLKEVWAKWKSRPADATKYWYGGPQLHHSEGLEAFGAIEASDLKECTFDVVIDESIWEWGARENYDELSR